jgi:hypothetical protein
VIVAWATLGLTGRWRPEPSWLDRAGRAIGLFVTISAIVIIGLHLIRQ